jgi:hypothetical protein
VSFMAIIFINTKQYLVKVDKYLESLIFGSFKKWLINFFFKSTFSKLNLEIF